jgi:hypothetical protein
LCGMMYLFEMEPSVWCVPCLVRNLICVYLNEYEFHPSMYIAFTKFNTATREKAKERASYLCPLSS